MNTGDEIKAAADRCEECGNTGIVGDGGPGRRNVHYEWVPCDCSHGDKYRDLTPLEMALHRQNEELRAELKAAKEIAGKYEDKYFSAHADLEAARKAIEAKDAALILLSKGIIDAFVVKEAAKALEPSAGSDYISRDQVEKMQELLKQVMDWHSDPGSAEYNQCDTDPCSWCEMAQATFDAGEQP
jgi:hypothetical protein